MSGVSISEWTNRQASQHNLPLSVLAELTYLCNQKCYYCYNRPSNQRRELSDKVWEKILGQLEEMGTLYLTISGGEPFCRKDILDILLLAVKRSFSVTLFSNGTFIDAPTAKFLSELGLLEVGISFHASDPQLHDRLAGFEGSFHAAYKALCLLQSHSIRTIIKHTVTRENFGEYEALSRMAAEEGAIFEADSIVFPFETSGASEFCISQGQQRALLEFMELKPSPSPNTENLHCDAGRSVMGLNPYGDILPCIQLPVVFGNACRKPIKDIWHGPAARDFRAREMEMGADCGTCEKRSYCARCPGLSLLETGQWSGGSPSTCSRATLIESIANRTQ